MDNLIYKTFVWPQNPANCRQLYQRKAVYGKNEADETVFLGLSGLKHTLTGSGTFTGPEALENFRLLADLCGDPTAGALTHPVWGTVTAFLTELQMDREPRKDFIAYSFTFQVADSQGAIPQ